MSLLVPDEGELELLGMIRSAMNLAPVSLRLYQNDLTPSDSDELADYVEADFDGYAALGLGVWSVPIPAASRAFITEALKVFEDTTGLNPNDIYGYYVVNNAGSKVLWAERFGSAPIAIEDIGDQVIVTPTLTLRSEP